MRTAIIWSGFLIAYMIRPAFLDDHGSVGTDMILARVVTGFVIGMSIVLDFIEFLERSGGRP